MMNTKKKTQDQINEQYDCENHASNLYRARSVTVGTAFGGITEIMMRGNGDRFLWALMQPVEVVEFINQLAANIGCHIYIKPRDDFSSWRTWREGEVQPSLTVQWPEWSNHPPLAEETHDMNKLKLENNNDTTVAIEKDINKSTTE